MASSNFRPAELRPQVLLPLVQVRQVTRRTWVLVDHGVPYVHDLDLSYGTSGSI
jgi:hypothetical protein